jgi:hypothetical protein
MAQRDPFGISIHHSASSLRLTVAAMRRDHISRGYSDIGYHHIIDGNAKLHQGRAFGKRGAHSGPKGNAYTGLLIVGYNGDEIERVRHWTDRGGNKRVTRTMVPNPGWQWTPAQIERAQQYLDDYRGIFPGTWFKGHREFKATLCPGLDVHTVFK